VVLLIDELNVLGKPLDTDGASLLSREFLDKAQRYLVFSTTEPMDLDTTIPTIDKRMGRFNIKDLPSPRGCVVLSMPFCTDVAKMRSMFGTDRSVVVTPAHIAYRAAAGTIGQML
jgi:hypothetical protein